MTDELVLDLSNYKDRVGSRVPPDTYRVQVEDVEMTESANKNPMINVWFTILEGESQGQTLTDRLVLTEKSLFRVVGFMNAIGLPTPKKKLKLNIRQFVGKVLDVDIDDGEPYNGRIRSEVRGYNKVPGANQSAGADLPDEAPSTSVDAVDLPAPEATTALADPAKEETAPTSAAADSDDLDLTSVEL